MRVHLLLPEEEKLGESEGDFCFSLLAGESLGWATWLVRAGGLVGAFSGGATLRFHLAGLFLVCSNSNSCHHEVGVVMSSSFLRVCSAVLALGLALGVARPWAAGDRKLVFDQDGQFKIAQFADRKEVHKAMHLQTGLCYLTAQCGHDRVCANRVPLSPTVHYGEAEDTLWGPQQDVVRPQSDRKPANRR